MANPLFDALFAPLQGKTTPLLILPDGSEITGDAFHSLICRIANTLQSNGIAPGNRVAAQIAKSPEGLALYGACTALGAVFLLDLSGSRVGSKVDYGIGNDRRAIGSMPAVSAGSSAR